MKYHDLPLWMIPLMHDRLDLWMMTSKQYMVDIHGEFAGDLGKTRK